ncbi:MAG: type II secretion system F family protein [Rhodospirillales bacterium]
MFSYLSPVMLREDVIALFVALSAFLIVLTVWRTLLARNPMAARLKALEHRRKGLRDEMLNPKRRGAELRAEHVHLMRRVIGKLNLMRGGMTGAASAKLEQAGWRSRDALIAYLFLKLVLPIGAGIFALVMISFLNIYDLEPVARVTASLAVVLLFAYAPDLFIKNAADKRRAKLTKAVPDALDLMVICTEAGLSLDATLARVSRELGETFPALGDELSLTTVELGFLPERAKALENLARRCGLASVRGLVSTLVQTEKYGTPLSNSLRVLASEFRNERMLRAEAKAAKLPATLTVPMVLFIMPALFVVLLGPAVIRTIDSIGGL